MNLLNTSRWICTITLAVAGWLLVTQPCGGQQTAPAPQTKKELEQTLQSFKQLDKHPLFEMTYHGDYVADAPIKVSMKSNNSAANWACSIFVSFGKDGSAIYGRNFDWWHNPALLLHTHPSDGYASVSMVDISYLGFEMKDEKTGAVRSFTIDGSHDDVGFIPRDWAQSLVDAIERSALEAPPEQFGSG